MISLIFFIVVFALKLELNRMKHTKKTPSELTKKITRIFRYTAIGIGSIIILTSIGLGINVSTGEDILGWVSLVISTGIGIGIAISINTVQQEQNKRLEDQNTKIEKLVIAVHAVSGYLEKRLKGKERYASWAMKNKLDLLEMEFNHIINSLYPKWINEIDSTRKDNFYNSMRSSYDRCFEQLKLVSLPPLELRDIFEDHIAGMIQTMFSKVGLHSSLYFESGDTVEENMPAFINHVKECQEITKNVMKVISPIASSYVKGD